VAILRFDGRLNQSGVGASTPINDRFTPGAGQTVFVLSAIPTSFVTFTIDGLDYYSPETFVVIGNQLVWNDTEFVISVGQVIAAKYFV